jgi:hypothetical protein
MIPNATTTETSRDSRTASSIGPVRANRRLCSKEPHQAAGLKQTAGTQSTNLIDLNRQLNGLQLPMGWANSPADAGAWVIKLLGLLLTSIAVSLGAPFWFGVLNKIVNIRAAGPSPAEVPTPQQV